MIIAILISIHLLADFLFQTSAYSERKRQVLSTLFLHSFIYFIIFVAILAPIFEIKKIILFSLIISTSHFFINVIKNKLEKIFPQRRLQFLFFSFNQLLHFIVILIFYYILNLENFTSQLYIDLKDCEHFKTFILYITVFSIILDPASVLIRKLFISISPKTYPIGFVLTAKSIARFKQMEDKNFAEKYLIGTLTSFLIVLITVLILKGLL